MNKKARILTVELWDLIGTFAVVVLTTASLAYIFGHSHGANKVIRYYKEMRTLL